MKKTRPTAKRYDPYWPFPQFDSKGKQLLPPKPPPAYKSAPPALL